MFRNDIILTKNTRFFFIGYPNCYPLELYVVVSLAGGAVLGHGFWVQPFGNGCSGFIQPVRLAA
jgi:hypothetical protein